MNHDPTHASLTTGIELNEASIHSIKLPVIEITHALSHLHIDS